MRKDEQLDAWNHIKKKLHNSSMLPKRYTEGEVWWTCLGCNIGYEEDGKGKEFSRPVIIIKGFSKSVIWTVPLSTTSKRGKYYMDFKLRDSGTSVALLSQLRVLDTKRLLKSIGIVDKRTLSILKLKLRQLL